MRSTKISMWIPNDVLEALGERMEVTSSRNRARYTLTLYLADIMNPCENPFAHAIANADPKLQDELLDAFLKMSKERARQLAIDGVRAVKSRKKASKP